jgi:hypothetical protein
VINKWKCSSPKPEKAETGNIDYNDVSWDNIKLQLAAEYPVGYNERSMFLLCWSPDGMDEFDENPVPDCISSNAHDGYSYTTRTTRGVLKTGVHCTIIKGIVSRSNCEVLCVKRYACKGHKVRFSLFYSKVCTNDLCDFKIRFNVETCVLPSTATICTFCGCVADFVSCPGHRRLVFIRNRLPVEDWPTLWKFAILSQLGVPHNTRCPVSRSRQSSEMKEYRETAPASSAKKLKMELLAYRLADGASFEELVKSAEGFVAVPRISPKISGSKSILYFICCRLGERSGAYEYHR